MVRKVDIGIIAASERPNVGDESFAKIVASGVSAFVGYALAPLYIVIGVGAGPVAAYTVGAVAGEGVFRWTARDYGRAMEV
jgi:hypothetical protein